MPKGKSSYDKAMKKAVQYGIQMPDGSAMDGGRKTDSTMAKHRVGSAVEHGIRGKAPNKSPRKGVAQPGIRKEGQKKGIFPAQKKIEKGQSRSKGGNKRQGMSGPGRTNTSNRAIKGGEYSSQKKKHTK